MAACYQMVSGNIFLNTAADDAEGLEKCADYALIPFQYAFGGYAAHLSNDRYELKQRFDYHQDFELKIVGAVITLPLSVMIGTTLKSISFLFPEVRARHVAIEKSIENTKIISNNDYYRSIGIDVERGHQKISSLGYQRRPGEEKTLSEAKEAFIEIIRIFNENKILFWADCGTCLGIYRYGGAIPWDNDIDIGILQPDFDNVKHVLNDLDKSKYAVQDWSNRLWPQSYLRVYIRSVGEFIDIYHFEIHPERRTIQFILSNESSIFLPEDWKIRSQPFKEETPFDEMFPLKIADFDGLEVPVPKDIKKYLQVRYGDNLEPSNIFNEVTGQYEKDLSHPYWR